jgi:hypothetical protein
MIFMGMRADEGHPCLTIAASFAANRHPDVLGGYAAENLTYLGRCDRHHREPS